jgi:hypothetical protein
MKNPEKKIHPLILIKATNRQNTIPKGILKENVFYSWTWKNTMSSIMLCYLEAQLIKFSENYFKSLGDLITILYLEHILQPTKYIY